MCDADLDTLQSLVEKSLLRFTDDRYWMLETIREYAGERLDVGEADGSSTTRTPSCCRADEGLEDRADVWLDRRADTTTFARLASA